MTDVLTPRPPGADTRDRGVTVRGVRIPPPLVRLWDRADLGTAALAAVILGSLLVVGLWWTTVPSVSGTADWLTHYGRVTGLLAGYLVAVVVVSMARIPALDRGVGPDRLARWHAWSGRYVLILILCHVVLITMGYAAHEGTSGYRQIVTMLNGMPDMWDALIGTVILLVVGFLSAAAMRVILRYEVWHGLHLLTYVGVYLAFWHQITAGGEFENSPGARWWWSAFYATVAAVVLWYRVITPIRVNLTHRFRVAGVAWEAPTVLSVMIRGDHLDRLDARPGQFFRWRFLTPALWWSANPYSLSAAPRDNLLRITVRTVGDHTAGLARLRRGDRVWVEGPYGALTVDRRRRRKVLLLAGGVGITPLRALFESMPGTSGDLSLIYRAHAREDLALWGELKDIADHRGANLWYIVNRDDGSRPELTAAALTDRLPDLAKHDIFICGPTGLTDEWRRLLRSAGVPERRIHHESFEF